uniref:Maturation n=1 Tax=Leviviridae sp. TaxID=2027243 RepID=A0A142D845_9VIRU|nr:maturation [Leviviridae sp.]
MSSSSITRCMITHQVYTTIMMNTSLRKEGIQMKESPTNPLASVFPAVETQPLLAKARTEALKTRPTGFSPVNWIENLAGAELGGYSKAIDGIIQGFHAYSRGDIRAAKRAFCDFYLFYKYVASNDYRDAVDTKDNAYDSKLALKSVWNGTFFVPPMYGTHRVNNPLSNDFEEYRAEYYFKFKDNILTRLFTSLDIVGLEPYSQNIWETLPYSFVIDWFVKVGDLLGELDSLFKSVVRYDLQARVDSIKRVSTRHVPGSMLAKHGATLLGGITTTYYTRNTYSNIGSLVSYVETGNFSVDKALQTYCLFYTNVNV